MLIKEQWRLSSPRHRELMESGIIYAASDLPAAMNLLAWHRHQGARNLYMNSINCHILYSSGFTTCKDLNV